LAISLQGQDNGDLVYDPKTNSWADPLPFPADGPKFGFAANTCYDRELNAYFCHVAGDSNDNGVVVECIGTRNEADPMQSPRVSRTWRPCQQRSVGDCSGATTT